MNHSKILLFCIILFSVSCKNDLCEDINCLNGGICNTETGNCDCVNDFTGEFCETAPDLCEDTNCLNGGNCNPATGACECIDGYTGEFCEIAPIPPTADFVYNENLLMVTFTNSSSNATDYLWNFGDVTNSTSVDENPTYEYTQFGIYTVTLIASNEYLSDTATTEITLLNTNYSGPLPLISEAGFEDNSNVFGCEDGQTSTGLPAPGDGRDCWRNDAGGVVQITASPVYDGNQAGKLPTSGDRIGMQEITVVPFTNYNLSFWYTMKTDPGTLTVAILDEFITDASNVTNATIASLQLTDNSNPEIYINEVLSFNSGSNTEVTIYFTNVGSESRIDNFEFIY